MQRLRLEAKELVGDLRRLGQSFKERRRAEEAAEHRKEGAGREGKERVVAEPETGESVHAGGQEQCKGDQSGEVAPRGGRQFPRSKLGAFAPDEERDEEQEDRQERRADVLPYRRRS